MGTVNADIMATMLEALKAAEDAMFRMDCDPESRMGEALQLVEQAIRKAEEHDKQ